MTIAKLILMLVCLVSLPLETKEAKVTPFLSKDLTLTPGRTFYEGPSDVHVVGRNASQTKPAKFVVFFVKDKGVSILEPAK